VKEVKLCECGCGKQTQISKRTNKARGQIKGQFLHFIKGHHVRPKRTKEYWKEYYTNYYVKNKEAILEQNKAYRKKDPEKTKAQVKKTNLWVKYRLTPEGQTKIEDFQKQHPIFRILLGKRLGTDHNHKTGLVRGRLEWRLNRAYGLIEKVCPENTAAVLRALAEFHENPPATTALGVKTFGLIGVAQYKKKMIYGSENGPIKPEKKARKCKR
jgi:hypothetical protein